MGRTWKLKLLHPASRSEVVLILVDFPECSTDMFMFFFAHLVVFLAAMGGVSAVGAFVCWRFALCLGFLFLACGAGAVGGDPLRLGTHGGERRLAEGME